MKSFQAQTHYEVLEISVGATVAEIRSAYERLTQLYSDDQVVLYGLIDPQRATALRTRLKEALEVLSNEGRREAYDLTIGLPPRERPKPPDPSQPRPVETSKAPVTAGTGWGGSYSWVTSQPVVAAPSAPNTYTYTAPVSAPVRVVAPPSAPAPALAPVVEAVAPPAPSAPAVVEVAPEPAPVAPPEPVAAVETKVVESAPVEAPPEPSPAPVVLPPPPPSSPPVEAAEPAPAPPAPVEEPPVPRLSDENVEMSIVPVRPPVPREFKVEQRPKPYEVPPDVEFNGDLLRQVRMARGLSLVQLAERTRIGTKHLENVEGDRYDALPAPVYLRGILMNLARELGLDGLRVSKSYLTFVEAHRSKG